MAIVGEEDDGKDMDKTLDPSHEFRLIAVASAGVTRTEDDGDDPGTYA